jgi:hypothetical protein
MINDELWRMSVVTTVYSLFGLLYKSKELRFVNIRYFLQMYKIISFVYGIAKGFFELKVMGEAFRR